MIWQLNATRRHQSDHLPPCTRSAVRTLIGGWQCLEDGWEHGGCPNHHVERRAEHPTGDRGDFTSRATEIMNGLHTQTEVHRPMRVPF